MDMYHIVQLINMYLLYSSPKILLEEYLFPVVYIAKELIGKFVIPHIVRFGGYLI